MDFSKITVKAGTGDQKMWFLNRVPASPQVVLYTAGGYPNGAANKAMTSFIIDEAYAEDIKENYLEPALLAINSHFVGQKLTFKMDPRFEAYKTMVFANDATCYPKCGLKNGDGSHYSVDQVADLVETYRTPISAKLVPIRVSSSKIGLTVVLSIKDAVQLPDSCSFVGPIGEQDDEAAQEDDEETIAAEANLQIQMLLKRKSEGSPSPASKKQKV